MQPISDEEVTKSIIKFEIELAKKTLRVKNEYQVVGYFYFQRGFSYEESCEIVEYWRKNLIRDW